MVEGAGRAHWSRWLAAILLCALWLGCESEAPPPLNLPTPEAINTREWPSPRAARGTTSSSALGQIISAGGVEGGTWVPSDDGLFLGHVGSPGEPNIFRVWSTRQGSWARQVHLPFSPTGPLAFSRDGRSIAFAMAGGGIWLLTPSGAIDAIPPGPCLSPSHILGIPKGGWIVVGSGGCVARFRAGEWIQGPDTGISRALEVSPLTRGEPVIAGLSPNAKPAASIWWPEGVVQSFQKPGEVAKRGEGAEPSEEEEAVPRQGDIITLDLPPSGKAPGWADITPTLVGSVYVAMDGVSLTGYDPGSGEPIGLPMPKSGPWAPLAGAVVSKDSSYFYALNQNGLLVGGPTALWEGTWKSTVPGDTESMGFKGVWGGMLMLQGKGLHFLDVPTWSSLPSPPGLDQRPWQPLSVAFGNNGRGLAVSYASPSVGGTSRWVTLWGFEGKNPRRVALGTLKHPGKWKEFLKVNRPSSPVAGNPRGTRYGVQGPTGIQLFETSTGVRAGHIDLKDAMSLVFGEGDDTLFVAQTSGWITRFDIEETGALKEKPLVELDSPPLLMARSGQRLRLGVVRGVDGGGMFEVRAPEGSGILGKLEVTGTPQAVALSPRGDRGVMAIPERGIYQWPGGAAIAEGKDSDDRFTAVAYHPRTEELTYAGRDRSIWRRDARGRSKVIGVAAGDVLDIVYHPLGRCMAVALGSGRVEIWGAEGPALSIELWEGGRWTAWVPKGEAVGSKSLVEALRLLEENDLTRPVVASTESIPTAIQGVCGR